MTIENGIDVIRIKTLPHHNVNYILRGISQLIMPLQFLLKINNYGLNFDAVVIYSPPLPLGFLGPILRRKGAFSILNLQDLFPQNAIDLGIIKNRFLIYFYRLIESLIYKSVDLITVHSLGNKMVVEKFHPNLQKEKIHVLNNWISIEDFELNQKSHEVNYRLEWNIKQKYVALFAGVMGPSQNLELILRIAKHFQGNSEIMFLMVGDGSEKQRLMAYANLEGLDNVLFKNFVSRENYPSLLKACSIGLVSLSPQNQTPVVPGKILGYMAARMPVAAFLHSKSDGHNLIQEAGAGVVADSADLESCIGQMEYLMNRPGEFGAIGDRAYEYAKVHFSKDACVSKIENILLHSMKK